MKKLPASARKIRMYVTSEGDAAKYDNVTFKAAKVEKSQYRTLHSLGQWPVMREDPSKVVSDAELDRILAVRERCVPELSASGDRTELNINGKTVTPKIYKTSAVPTTNRYPSVAAAAKMGFNIVTVNIPFSTFGNDAGIWRPDGSCDTEWVRRELREHLKRHPHGMFMFVLTMKPHVGWAEKTPGEIMADEKGRFGIYSGCRLRAYRDKIEYNPKWEFPMFSYASDKYAADASKMLESLFVAVESWPEGKAVIGVYVCGGADTQWHDIYDKGGFESNLNGTPLADHSPVMKRRFAEYLRTKYGRTDVDAHIPAKDEIVCKGNTYYSTHSARTLCSDYREFEGRSANEMRLALAGAIKRATKGRMLVGSYLPNGGAMGYSAIANSCVQELMESPAWDFFAVVPHYRREYIDPIYFPVFYGSAVRHGKLVIGEMDIRSADVGNYGFWHGDFWRSNHNEKTFRRKAMQVAAAAIVQGGGLHAYDMHGGWYATEAAQATWSAVNSMVDNAHAMPLAPETIAFVGSERYSDFKAWNPLCLGAVAMLREIPRLALARIGAPNTYILAEELLNCKKSTELPKVVIFNDLSAIDFAQYSELKCRYAKDGRVIVWMWRPGIFAEDGAKIDEDLGIVPINEQPAYAAFSDGTNDDPLMKGVSGTILGHYPSFGLTHCAPGGVPDLSKGWKRLANIKGTDVPALAVRRHSGYTEVYSSIQGGITPQLCRNLLREAGMRPLLETDDISGYGSGIFYILAQKDGVKRFRLPDGAVAGNTLEGPAFKAEDNGTYSVPLKQAQMFIVSVKEK